MGALVTPPLQGWLEGSVWLGVTPPLQKWFDSGSLDHASPIRGLPRSRLVVSKSWLSSMLGLGRCVDDVVGLRGWTTWLDVFVVERKSWMRETTRELSVPVLKTKTTRASAAYEGDYGGVSDKSQ